MPEWMPTGDAWTKDTVNLYEDVLVTSADEPMMQIKSRAAPNQRGGNRDGLSCRIRFGIVQLSVSVSKKGFGPGTILGPENEPEDWAWNETKQGSIIKVLCIGVSKFSNEFLLDS